MTAFYQYGFKWKEASSAAEVQHSRGATAGGKQSDTIDLIFIFLLFSSFVANGLAKSACSILWRSGTCRRIIASTNSVQRHSMKQLVGSTFGRARFFASQARFSSPPGLTRRLFRPCVKIGTPSLNW